MDTWTHAHTHVQPHAHTPQLGAVIAQQLPDLVGGASCAAGGQPGEAGEAGEAPREDEAQLKVGEAEGS